MNKSQLVDQLATSADISKAAAGRFLEAFIQTVTDALTAGDQVMLAGFGTFVVRQRPARTGRDPRTGNPIAIMATKVTSFRAAKTLKEHLN